LLPLSSRGDPARFATIEAGLRAAGWTVGLAAADSRALDWVEAPGLAWAVPAGAGGAPAPAGAAHRARPGRAALVPRAGHPA
jgi:hypothetical protein